MKYAVQSGIGSIARAVCARVGGAFSRCLSQGKSRRGMAATLAVTGALVATGTASGQVVISQVYGGGGNTGAQYTNDFIELFNRGTSSVSLNGWSVQYASSAGTTWTNTNLPNVTLAPGRYFLIQGASTGTIGLALPSPDVTGTIAMSTTDGKVALVSSTTALAGGFPRGGTVVDFVGYGSANWFEGRAAAPAPSGTTAVFREFNGCSDTDNNANDFTTAAPAPRNGATAASTCSVQPQLVTSRADCSTTAPIIDGIIDPNEYGTGNTLSYTGGGTGFGGGLGGGTLYMKSSVTNLNLALQTNGLLSGTNYVVVYLNTKNSGFTDPMNDSADPGRRVVTRLTVNGGVYNNNSFDPFPFAADYAVLIGNSFATVFQLGSGSLATVTSISARTNVMNSTCEVEIPFANFSPALTVGTTVDFFAAYCSDTNFNSNESIPAMPTLNGNVNPAHGATGGTYDRYNRFTVSGLSAPIITTQPPSTAATCLGGALTFGVQVTGASGQLTYQWRRDGVALIGQTGPFVVITNATALDAGSYDVIVSNGCTSVTSSPAAVTVPTLPIITVQPPATAGRCTGSSGTISVTATGSGTLSYLWQQITDGGTNWGLASSVGSGTQPTLVTNPTATAGTLFRCIVTNAGVCSVTSTTTSLTVNTLPAVATAPTTSFIAAAGSAAFNISATPPSGSTIDWYTGLCVGGTLVPGGAGVTSLPISTAVPGTTTYFARSRENSTGCLAATCVSITVQITPSNDTCAGAIALSLDTPLAGTTAGANNDYQLVAASTAFAGLGQAASTAPGREVVYTFTPPTTGSYSLKVWRNAAFNPVLYIAAGPCPTGVTPIIVTALLAANRNTSTTPNFSGDELYNLTLTGGTLYFVFVDDATLGTGTVGSFLIEVNRCNNEVEPNGTPATANAYVF